MDGSVECVAQKTYFGLVRANLSPTPGRGSKRLPAAGAPLLLAAVPMGIAKSLTSDVSGAEAVELLLMAISKSEQLNNYSREQVTLRAPTSHQQHLTGSARRAFAR